MDEKPARTIAFVNSSIAWGGGERWHFDAAEFLHKLGYRVIFFCAPHSALEKQLRSTDIHIEHLSISNLSFLNPFKHRILRHRLRELDIQTLFMNSPADVKLAAPAARSAGIENIIFRRGMPHRVKDNPLNKWLFEAVVTTVIANSQSVAHSLRKSSGGIVPDSKVLIIENGTDFEAPADSEPLIKKPENCLVLSTAGRMVKQKNQLILLDIAEKLDQQELNYLLIIAGSGELETELRNQIHKRQLENRVYLPGFVPNIHTLFMVTDVFIFPSLYEGSSNTIIEAAGAGLPIIASDIPPNREILSDASIGRLVPVDDVQAYCAAINDLATQPEIRRQTGINARNSVRTRFDLEHSHERLLDII